MCMSSYPTNLLQTVTTYNRSGLALLQNQNAAINTFNHKFTDFNTKIAANLGSVVNLDLPPRNITSYGLVPSLQAADQRVISLTVDQAANVSYAINAQQLIFNVDKTTSTSYLPVFMKSGIAQLGAAIEKNVLLSISGEVPVYTVNSQGQSVPTGQFHTESGPFRFAGNGVTAINSYQQLAQFIANFKDFGSVVEGTDFRFYMPVTDVPAIVGNGLSQFAPMRNNDIAMSWEIGEFGQPRIKFYSSNLLPTHVSGTVGNSTAPNNVLTVVSVNDPTGQNVTQITCSGATANDPNAIFNGDLFQFNDGVSGKQNLRYLTFIGQNISQQPVQNRITASVGADNSGNVVLNLANPLVWAASNTQNLNTPIVAGMQLTMMPSHKQGLITCGDAAYIAMPKLPNTEPFMSSVEQDPDTGASLRFYHGYQFPLNQYAYIHDCTWGSLIVPEYTMRVLFPM